MATQADAADPSSVFKNEEGLKKSITELKSYSNPPVGIKKTMTAVAVLLGYDTSWKTAKKLLSNSKFIDTLKTFDKDNINPEAMETVRRLIDDQDFNLERMKKISHACYVLCKWVLALEKYDSDRTSKVQGGTGKE